jgi:hypothetical protein
MRASEKQKPRWFWTGVMPLDGMEDDSRLRELVAMLPARKSSDREILTYLVDLRARFLRWMHQDEFGPDRVVIDWPRKAFEAWVSVNVTQRSVPLPREALYDASSALRFDAIDQRADGLIL